MKGAKIYVLLLLLLLIIGGLGGLFLGKMLNGNSTQAGKSSVQTEKGNEAAENTPAPTATEEPVPTVTETLEIPDGIPGEIALAINDNNANRVAELIRYQDENWNMCSYPQEMVEACVGHMHEDIEAGNAFLTLLQGADIHPATVASEQTGEGVTVLILPDSDLFAMTQTDPVEITSVSDMPQSKSNDSTFGNANSKGLKVAIDAGHQGQGNSEQEPIGPGAGETKAKVASGTYGPASGLNEYELNLQVSLKLRDELQKRGYEVYMIRESHDVDISNSQRAISAAESGADILVRIHANGSDDSSVQGALTMAPSTSNAFVADIAPECQRLSQDIIDAFVTSTGANNQGVYITDEMSGINWSTIPVTIVEMGYMTNSEEDLRMASDDYQAKMVEGIANGIDAYFAGN